MSGFGFQIINVLVTDIEPAAKVKGAAVHASRRRRAHRPPPRRRLLANACSQPHPSQLLLLPSPGQGRHERDQRGPAPAPGRL